MLKKQEPSIEVQEYRSKYFKNINSEYTVTSNYVINIRYIMEYFEFDHAKQIYIDKKFRSVRDFTLNFTRSPFGNCQNFCIPYFSNIIYSDFNIMDIFSIIYNRLDKPICILDLNLNIYNKFKTKIKEEKAPITVNIKKYINTNGSKMVLCIVKLDTVKCIVRAKELIKAEKYKKT
jgi:hypothetical protein